MSAKADPELSMLCEMAHQFANGELTDTCQENDRFPIAPLFGGVLEKAREVGFFDLTVPEELEGGGMDMVALCLALQTLCRYDASIGGVVFTDALAKEVLVASADPAALTGVLSREGDALESLIAFPSYRDPSEGTSLTAIAVDGGSHRLSGDIESVVLAGVASTAVLPAAIEGRDGYSFFTVSLNGGGVTTGSPVQGLGLRACPAADLSLNGAQAAIVGKAGEGARYFDAAAARMGAAAAAMALGIMKGSFEEALEYARQRRQGGREIINWSEVRRILADMAIKTRVAEMLVFEAGYSVEEKEEGWEQSSRAASLAVGQMACELTDDGIQVLGGNGYMEDYGQEKRFRDARQVQSLLGLVPRRKLEYVRRVVEGESEY
jgi:alkylation response protein AidB-like acyl-CoA dehydrogenase